MKSFCDLCSCADSIKPEKAGFIVIVISIIAALLMLISSYLIKGTEYAEYSQTITYTIMAIWWLPFFVLSRRSGTGCNIKK